MLFVPPPFMALGLKTVSFVTSVTSTSNHITIPAGVLVGDLLTLFDMSVDSGGTPSDVVPANWTRIKTGNYHSTYYTRYTASCKLAVGGDAGLQITGLNADYLVGKVMTVHRGDKPIKSISVQGLQFVVDGGGSQPDMVITSGSGGLPLVVYQCAASEGGGSLSPSWSPDDWKGVDSNQTIIAFKSMNRGSVPANCALNVSNWHGACTEYGFYVQCS